MSDGIKMLTPHSANCYLAAEGREEFIVWPREPEPRMISRAKDGTLRGCRKGGGTSWFVFVCNDIDCPGRVMVRWDTLMKFIVAGLQSEPRLVA